jgi:peptidoglycan/LPS O-acetylase OafA/YrhL
VNHLLALTGLRGVAALWVMAFHLFGIAEPRKLILTPPFDFLPSVNLTWLVTTGWLGVHIFYVLSAFLLSYPFLTAAISRQAAPSLRGYAIRRFMRILPAYYLQIGILFMCTFYGLWPAFSALDGIKHLTMMHGTSWSVAGAINGVFWTLPVEFLFYFLLPFLALILVNFARKRVFVGVGFFMFFVMLTVLVKTNLLTGEPFPTLGQKIWRMGQLDALGDLFIAGLVTCWLFSLVGSGSVTIASRTAVALAICGTVGLLCLGAVIAWNHETYWTGGWLLRTTSSFGAISTGALVLGLALSARNGRDLFGLASAPMQWFGTRSFSIYLWHDPVLRWTQRGLRGLGVEGDLIWPIIFLGGTLVFLISELSYRIAEKPFLRGHR